MGETNHQISIYNSVVIFIVLIYLFITWTYYYLVVNYKDVKIYNFYKMQKIIKPPKHTIEKALHNFYLTLRMILIILIIIAFAFNVQLAKEYNPDEEKDDMTILTETGYKIFTAVMAIFMILYVVSIQIHFDLLNIDLFSSNKKFLSLILNFIIFGLTCSVFISSLINLIVF